MPGGEGPFEKSIPEFIKSEHQEGEAAIQHKAKKRDEEALSALAKASPWLQSTLEQNGNLGSLLRNYLGGRQVVEGDVL